MFRSKINISGNQIIDDLILIVISLLAIVFLGAYQFDLVNGLPITLQSLLVVEFSLLFGTRIGVISVISYLLIAGLGAPIFSGGASGWEHFTGPTGGFLLAFPIAALICGYLVELSSKYEALNKHIFITGAIILFLSQIVILILGLGWQDALSSSSIIYSTAFDILMPGLLVKTALGTIIFVLFGRAINNITPRS
ncbi:MAG: hypothetical protein COA49_08560 [Bacteroidetes bacterium]|nr:MAG: hypothetical protein COA49_08560 [Bacteroidota bacterium]